MFFDRATVRLWVNSPLSLSTLPIFVSRVVRSTIVNKAGPGLLPKTVSRSIAGEMGYGSVQISYEDFWIFSNYIQIHEWKYSNGLIIAND